MTFVTVLHNVLSSAVITVLVPMNQYDPKKVHRVSRLLSFGAGGKPLTPFLDLFSQARLLSDANRH